MSDTATIPGYRYGDPGLAPSPVTKADLDLLLATLLWTDEDTSALRRAGEVLAGQADQILDLWYGYVGSHPHLVASFAGPDGAPDGRYLERVRARFKQWILDTCTRPYDQAWLDYQHEIALRHHRTKKNQTDEVDSPATQVPLRYLVAFVWPITATIRDFLAGGARDSDELDAMHRAWFKSVVLQATLWSQPYAPADW